MSLPITAVGPLNVLTNPIFTDCCATAGAVPSAARATVPKSILFMFAVLQKALTKFRAMILVDRLGRQKPLQPWTFVPDRTILGITGPPIATRCSRPAWAARD